MEKEQTNKRSDTSNLGWKMCLYHIARIFIIRLKCEQSNRCCWARIKASKWKICIRDCQFISWLYRVHRTPAPNNTNSLFDSQIEIQNNNTNYRKDIIRRIIACKWLDEQQKKKKNRLLE